MRTSIYTCNRPNYSIIGWRQTVTDWAIRYHQLGLCPIPTHFGYFEDEWYACSCLKPWCGKTAGKHPAIEWKQYQIERPAIDQVRLWFAGAFAGFNIGTVHGAITRTVLLDADGLEGLDSQHDLEHRLGRLPAAPTVLTGGGGMHQLFRHPDCHIPTASGLAPAFDVRGDGGFSVLPPSNHARTMRDYVWDIDNHIDDVPIADLPPAWIEFISQPVAGMKSDKAVEWTAAPDGTELVTDGRETFMRDAVYKSLHRLHEELRRVPDLDELFTEAVANYAPFVDLKKAGRGLDQLREKCVALSKRVKSGRIKLQEMSPLERLRAKLKWRYTRPIKE